MKIITILILFISLAVMASDEQTNKFNCDLKKL
jgi:hypothetical protein